MYKLSGFYKRDLVINPLFQVPSWADRLNLHFKKEITARFFCSSPQQRSRYSLPPVPLLPLSPEPSANLSFHSHCSIRVSNGLPVTTTKWSILYTHHTASQSSHSLPSSMGPGVGSPGAHLEGCLLILRILTPSELCPWSCPPSVLPPGVTSPSFLT